MTGFSAAPKPDFLAARIPDARGLSSTRGNLRRTAFPIRSPLGSSIKYTPSKKGLINLENPPRTPASQSGTPSVGLKSEGLNLFVPSSITSTKSDRAPYRPHHREATNFSASNHAPL